MICGYLPCRKEAEISEKTGKFKKYCCQEHATHEGTRITRKKRLERKELAGLKSLNEADIGRNVAEEARVENIKNMKQALKGDKESQQMLKSQSLTYHYRAGVGEWGKKRGKL